MPAAVFRPVPNVFTIAPGQDAAREVVTALLDGRLTGLALVEDRLRLADVTIYVPTRRMRAVVEQAFAEALAPFPAILPRIRPLGEPGDPLDMAMAQSQSGQGESGIEPSPILSLSGMERRFLLLPAIAAWRAALVDDDAAKQADFPELYALATALGRLIDEARIDGVPLARLETITPQEFDPAAFDEYWSKTRDFLALAAREWPAMLKARHAQDEMEARLLAIEAEAARLEASGAPHPIIVLGSTGSVLATAKLMRAVSRCEYGAVVLPGLDQALDAQSWDYVGAPEAGLATQFAHPQASLKRTLATIGINRGDVAVLGAPPPALGARNRILSEAMRPAETSRHWHESRAITPIAEGLGGLRLLIANDEREEAEAIALLIRETLEHPAADIALVTADRALAAHVQAALARWGIIAQDSAGISLAQAEAGILLRLFLEAATKQDGVSLLALLRHPLTRLDYSAAEYALLVDALEIAVLRGRYFAPSLTWAERVRFALENRSAYPHPALARLAGGALKALPAFAQALDDLLRPFAPEAAPRPLEDWAEGLWQALLRLTRLPDGSNMLEAEASALPLHTMLMEVAHHGQSVTLPPRQIAGALTPMLMERVMPPPMGQGHPRVVILGPLESRLIMPSRLILGGLNEGSFPPIATGDPFLNRAMRLALGLQAPERRIGQSAHDFTMLAAHPDVILTRAKRVGGQPALPSRFIRRLEAFLGSEAWNALVKTGENWLSLARGLDAPTSFTPIPRPAPVPSGAKLPKRLSITEIKTLRRDPYAIYARHILHLLPLEAIDPPLDARERGTLLHDILEDYATNIAEADPEIALQRLRDIAAAHFRPYAHETEFFRFWWQTCEAMLPGFVAFHAGRKALSPSIAYELRGKLELDVPASGTLTLSGKADRLERDGDGALTIIDYKSGMPPSPKQVVAGYEPQLTITAAMALRGGFPTLGEVRDIASLAYLPIGNKDVSLKVIKMPDGFTPAALAEMEWARLMQELADYASGARGYTSRLRPFKGRESGDYDHLARVQEWSLTGGQEDEEDDEGEGADG